MFNTISEQTVGRFIYELDNKNWEIPQLRELLEEIIPNTIFLRIMRWNTICKCSREKLLLNGRQIFHGEKETNSFFLQSRDKV